MSRETVLALWSEHRRTLRERCLRLLGNQADADDAMGDTLVKVLRHDRLDEIHHPVAWFYRLTFNICIDILRARRREGLLLQSWADHASGDGVSVGRVGVDDAEQLYLQREFYRELRRALDRLPRPLRQVLMMRVNDASYANIAAHDGITQENARKRVQQARSLLRVELQLLGAPDQPGKNETR